LHASNLDFLDTVAFWCFRAALLIVFVAWLARHVIHELKALIPAIRELRMTIRGGARLADTEDPKVLPNSSA